MCCVEILSGAVVLKCAIRAYIDFSVLRQFVKNQSVLSQQVKKTEYVNLAKDRLEKCPSGQNSTNLKKTTKRIISKYIDKIIEEFEKENSTYMKNKKNNITMNIYNDSGIVKDKAKRIKTNKLKKIDSNINIK